MKVLYVDLSPSWGGSLASLARLFERLDLQACQPLLLLADQNRAAASFRARSLPVYTVPTFRAEAARNIALVRQVKATPMGQKLRTGRLAPLWHMARGVRSTVLRTWPLTFRLWRIISALRPDLVHVNDAIFVNRPAIAAAWLARVPAICHVRSLGRLSWWDRLWAWTLRGFIFVSRWVAQDQAAQGVSPACSRVIYDGVDLAAYAHVPVKAEARAALGLPLDRKIVLSLGRLVPWKGQDLFLRALRRVADVRSDVLGLVAGAPEPYSLDFEPALHALADELQLADAVRFTGP
ncbi:MAG: glycosyltransferase, partial [Anaerolineae bacterium]|nr:glycosyltransferase [Anaerolineae bacterium]